MCPALTGYLFAGCIGVMWLFKKSEAMEAAYGLSITVAMMMTTILISNFLRRKKVPMYIVTAFFVMYYY
jgi:KUP system potassium uptake protein